MNFFRRHGLWLATFFLTSTPLFLAQAQPSITVQPAAHLNVTVGSSTSFQVTASAPSGTLSYQWRINGVNLAGATSSVLPLSNIQPTNCGAYSVAVSDGNLAINSSAAELTVNILTATGNDNFTSYYLLPSNTNGYVRGSNVLATAEVGETNYPAMPALKTIWFRWTAPTNGIVTFTTSGSAFDTVLSAGFGTVLSRLNSISGEIVDNDAGGFLTSKMSFNATQGTTYDISVDGHNGASGNVVLNWNEEPTSETLATISVLPDDHVAAPSVGNASFAVQSSQGSASQVQWYYNGVPLGGAAVGNTYRVSSVNLSTVGGYSARVTGFTPTGLPGNHFSFTPQSQLQANVHDDASTDTNSVAREKFLDSAASVPSQSGSGFVLKSGDSRGYTCSQIFSTVGGSKEPGEPNHCGQIGGASSWYSYKPPTNGMVHINTDGSSFNTILAVYIGPGDSFATLTNVGCGYTTNYSSLGQPHVYFSGDSKVTYYVVVDGYNGASGSAQLNLNNGTPLTITTPPTNQTVWTTSNATFTATANGATPIAYQWQHAGTNIAGATNTSLVISNVLAAKTGDYTVTASNVVTTANATANLAVYTAPAITTDVTNQTVIAGSNVTFVCAASGTAPLSYQWRVGNPGTNWIGATNSSLIITNTQAVNANSYRCIVTNVTGTVTSSVAILTVNIPPSISASPTNLTLGLGGTAVFNCQANGTGPLAYQWRYTGVSLPAATNTSLTLTNVQIVNAGSYDCVVTNIAGSAASATATLSVNFAPAITVQPAAHTVSPGVTAGLSVTATGFPAPSYQWKFNGANIGTSSSALILPNFQSTNEGTYQVVVTNAIGGVTSTEALLLLNSPLRVTTGGVTNGIYYLPLIGAIGSNYVAELSSDAVNWSPLQTNLSTNGFLIFTDPNTSTGGLHLYRTRVLP